MQIARPINLLPSLLLVVIGALTGSKGRTLLTLRSAAVWIVSVISGGVAVASVSVNDYFGECSDSLCHETCLSALLRCKWAQTLTACWCCCGLACHDAKVTHGLFVCRSHC